MDRRRKNTDPDAERELRSKFYADIDAGNLTLGEAVRSMQRISRLTQPEFAKHRKISIGALKQIEADEGNPKVETLNKIAEIFGLEIGFIRRKPR